METETLYEIKRAFAQEIERAVRQLIEEKHLYQSARVSEETLKMIVEERLEMFSEWTPQKVVDSLLVAYWSVNNPANRRLPFYEGSQEKSFDSLEFQVVSIRTLCGNCGEVSPMNLKKTTDAVSGIWDETGFQSEKDHSVYTFSYQCQNCRKGMEVFIIERSQNKFTLVGRSPMEQVKIPNYIPRTHQKYYSGAIIAFNSGQVLPALFMLRTLIEQYTRSEAQTTSGLADEILDEYMTSLPSDFKSRFPSLKQVYGDLSEAIHGADESEDLFVSSREKIDRHFDAKRLFGL